jgi:hypothetical protein
MVPLRPQNQNNEPGSRDVAASLRALLPIIYEDMENPG